VARYRAPTVMARGVTFTLPVPRGSHRPALAPWPWKRYSSRSLP
jgi:hypothetical protein